MADKLMTTDDMVAELRDGMTIGVGGWGSRRKPLDLVRAIARSDLKDLTLVAYGGPEVGILCALGKVSKLIFGFVSLDSIALEPHFRLARQNDGLEVLELDEGMFQWGLYAAALNLPFLPTRAGLGSDVMRLQPELKTVRSPYSDGEELVAVPALNLDAALIHVNRADRQGNGQILADDPMFDDLFAAAADATYMSTEKVIPTAQFADEGPRQTLKISRMHTRGVIESPHGAHFTECPPDYARDEAFQKWYASTAKDPAAWKRFVDEFVNAPSMAAYAERLEAFRAEAK